MSHLWIYLLLVVLIALEGEMTILLAAGAASAGFLNPWAVFGTAALGNIISDVSWYILGYYGRVDSLLHRFEWLGVTSKKLNLLKQIINRDAIRLLILAKLTNWMTIPTIVATGMAKVPWKRWFWLILVSDLLIAMVMVPLGYFMTSSLMQIQKGMRYIAFGFTMIFILVIISYVRYILNRKDLTVVFENPIKPDKPKNH